VPIKLPINLAQTPPPLPPPHAITTASACKSSRPAPIYVARRGRASARVHSIASRCTQLGTSSAGQIAGATHQRRAIRSGRRAAGRRKQKPLALWCVSTNQPARAWPLGTSSTREMRSNGTVLVVASSIWRPATPARLYQIECPTDFALKVFTARLWNWRANQPTEQGPLAGPHTHTQLEGHQRKLNYVDCRRFKSVTIV
jgi:hypothetical protein